MRRHVSMSDRMAATLGPACGLPTWIQFFRPKATGRIEFSARLLLNSSSGHSRTSVSLGQGIGARRLDPLLDDLQQGPGLLPPQFMPRGVVKVPRARLRVNGKQLVDRHQRPRGDQVSGVELQRLEELPLLWHASSR